MKTYTAKGRSAWEKVRDNRRNMKCGKIFFAEVLKSSQHDGGKAFRVTARNPALITIMANRYIHFIQLEFKLISSCNYKDFIDK